MFKAEKSTHENVPHQTWVVAPGPCTSHQRDWCSWIHAEVRIDIQSSGLTLKPGLTSPQQNQHWNQILWSLFLSLFLTFFLFFSLPKKNPKESQMLPSSLDCQAQIQLHTARQPTNVLVKQICLNALEPANTGGERLASYVSMSLQHWLAYSFFLWKNLKCGGYIKALPYQAGHLRISQETRSSSK